VRARERASTLRQRDGAGHRIVAGHRERGAGGGDGAEALHAWRGGGVSRLPCAAREAWRPREPEVTARRAEWRRRRTRAMGSPATAAWARCDLAQGAHAADRGAAAPRRAPPALAGAARDQRSQRKSGRRRTVATGAQAGGAHVCGESSEGEDGLHGDTSVRERSRWRLRAFGVIYTASVRGTTRGGVSSLSPPCVSLHMAMSDTT